MDHDPFCYVPILVDCRVCGASRDEGRETSMTKKDTETVRFRSFGPFLKSTLHLYRPRHEIDMPFSILLSRWFSEYPIKHLRIEPQKKIKGYYLTSWQCIRSEFTHFFKQDWNPAKRKECEIHFLAQTKPTTKWLFSLWFCEEKLCETSSTVSDDLMIAIRQISSEILQMILKNVFTNWIMRWSSAMKNVSECKIQ
jgi:hypothetical protein